MEVAPGLMVRTVLSPALRPLLNYSQVIYRRPEAKADVTSIFVNPRELEHFAVEIFPKINSAVILTTHNADDAIPFGINCSSRNTLLQFLDLLPYQVHFPGRFWIIPS